MKREIPISTIPFKSLSVPRIASVRTAAMYDLSKELGGFVNDRHIQTATTEHAKYEQTLYWFAVRVKNPGPPADYTVAQKILFGITLTISDILCYGSFLLTLIRENIIET